jgi:ferredoxin-nitrite reductase
LGDDGFRKAFHQYLREAQQQDLHFLPQVDELKKQGDHTVPQHHRVHPQKQDGLYYVEYHPLGGVVNVDTFLNVLQYLDGLDDVEIRLSPDESLYIINLTGTEAEKTAALTDGDAAANDFEKSTCCIGAAICQQGLRDSQGMFLHTVERLHKEHVNTDALPQICVSGCPSSCSTHLVKCLGLRGAAKKVEGEMKPAFTVFAGGDMTANQEQIGTQYGTLTEENIPPFFAALNVILTQAALPFAEWYAGNQREFADLVRQYE